MCSYNKENVLEYSGKQVIKLTSEKTRSLYDSWFGYPFLTWEISLSSLIPKHLSQRIWFSQMGGEAVMTTLLGHLMGTILHVLRAELMGCTCFAWGLCILGLIFFPGAHTEPWYHPGFFLPHPTEPICLRLIWNYPVLSLSLVPTTSVSDLDGHICLLVSLPLFWPVESILWVSS